MFTKEDVHSWNELFPECKIRDNDLTSPTEAFLTKILVAYLRSFGYKVDPPFALGTDSGENTREKRTFLITLTRHIDHMLKITDKSYAFTYLDLIRPTPKKTSHILGILLNYLYYYNMYKTDVFKMRNDAVTSRLEYIQQINRINKEHEQRKQRIEQIKKDSKKLNSQIPHEKAELKKLIAISNQQKVKLKMLKSEAKKYAAIVEELREQLRNLELAVVTDEEANELKSQHKKLEQLSVESAEFIVANEANLKDRKMQITTFETVLEKVEMAKNIVPEQMITKFKSMKKLLKDAQKQASALDDKKDEINSELKQQQADLTKIEAECEKFKCQLEAMITEKLETIAEKEKLCNEKGKILKYKHEEHRAIECLIGEQKAIKQYLDENLSLLMEPYTSEAPH